MLCCCNGIDRKTAGSISAVFLSKKKQVGICRTVFRWNILTFGDENGILNRLPEQYIDLAYVVSHDVFRTDDLQTYVIFFI